MVLWFGLTWERGEWGGIATKKNLPEDEDWDAEPCLVGFTELADAVDEVAEGAADGPLLRSIGFEDVELFGGDEIKTVDI